MTETVAEAGRALSPDLANDLSALPALDIKAMRRLWRERLETAAPLHLKSPSVFRDMLAYKLRERELGGLSSAARRKLREIDGKPESAVTPLTRLTPGAVLQREWRGQIHEVHVVEGGYRHESVTYKSLSQAASAITGVRWNGPRFFGMRERRA